MGSRMWRRAKWLGLAASLQGCSADQAPAPEPTLFTPGAIFAHRNPDGRYSLGQMLSEFHVNATESVFFIKAFSNTPSSIEEARQVCMGDGLNVSAPSLLVSGGSIEGSDVVWFRTLTEEDIAATR